MELITELLPEERRKEKPADEGALGFGRIMSDHMLTASYNPQDGWHQARIGPYQPLALDPAALVLHYGQEVFEGLKAYRGEDGGIYMFRPRDNYLRMNNSCARVCIPPVPLDDFLEHLFELIRVEQDWVPRAEGTSLYVRPTIIASEAVLGVQISKEYLYFVIVGPVGAYYPEGFNPVKIYVEEKYVRSVGGATGEAKTSANYVGSLLAAKEAHDKGYTQVLWLDACDRQTVEEVGTMNMFFKIAGEVITAPLGGSILPGLTRDSVLTLCRHWGMKVSERRLTIGEIVQAQKTGDLEEAFGTGTAAVISPVGHFHYQGSDYTVGDGQTGALSQKLYDEITGIQLGQRPDEFGWVVRVV